MNSISDIQINFDAFEASLNGSKGSKLHQKRQAAFDQFKKTGLPHKKHEEYRYVNLSAVKSNPFKVAQAGSLDIDINDFLIPGLEANVLLFVDGHFDAINSSIIEKGAFTIGNIKDAPVELLEKHFGDYNFPEYNPFASLNIAFARQGACVHVPKGKVIEKPIYLLHINTGSQSWAQPHHLIVADENSQCQIIEAFFSATEEGIDNSFLRIVADKAAIVDHYKLQAVGENANHFTTTHIKQERDAVCSTFVFNISGGNVRNNIHIELNAEHTLANMYGLYMTDGKEQVDNHTLVDHKFANCESNELYKGIMTGNSQATFNGKIFVQRDAQKTNAFQSNRNILLSDSATINTKPQLEIWADDVKCSHGATIGRLSKDELFYLKTRGIGEQKAKAMLTNAFATEVINLVKIPELKEFLKEGVSAKLGF